MSDFLPKPLRQADLMEMLKKHLSNHPKESENNIKTENYLDLTLLNEQTGDDEDFKRVFLKWNTGKLTQLLLSDANATSAASCEKREGNKLFLARFH